MQTISTLAVSECGNFTAIGTLSGSVGIFDTHEMKALYMAHETHGIFVTGNLHFLDAKVELLLAIDLLIFSDSSIFDVIVQFIS